MTVTVTYGWPPRGLSLFDVSLDLSEFMCLLSGLKGCVGLGPEWIIHLNGAAAITRVGSFTMSVPGFTSKLVEPWAVCHNPFRVDGLMCVMLGQFIRSTLNREEPFLLFQHDLDACFTQFVFLAHRSVEHRIETIHACFLGPRCQKTDNNHRHHATDQVERKLRTQVPSPLESTHVP